MPNPPHNRDPQPGQIQLMIGDQVGAGTDGASLRVRAMLLAEIGVRIDYFHQASDEHLRILGVDRALLPSPAAWLEFYEADYARPITDRENYSLAWERNGQVIGFSTADQITYGEQAFMHLHILEPGRRRAGLGARFVALSAAAYFEALALRRLYCQPNAYNVAPNRTLQRAGFRYVRTQDAAPSAINFFQPITRWVLEQAPGGTAASTLPAGRHPRPGDTGPAGTVRE